MDSPTSLGDPMHEDPSITARLDGLKAGDGADIQRLWDHYFERLVRLAGARLPRHARRASDEEDVALSAFQSFCAGVGRGQFAQMADRDDLWRVLATITVRKAIRAMRHQTRQKRGGGRVLGESAVLTEDDASPAGMGRFSGREPTPEEAAEFADDCDRLLGMLHDSTLRTIALRRLEGHTSEAIAVALGISSRTVERKIGLIRALWETGPS